jgi:hypothetical protein
MAEYTQPQVIPNPDIGFDVDPNTLKATDMNTKTATARVSMGNPDSKEVNKNGDTVQRGKGAATKGFTSSGPMA